MNITIQGNSAHMALSDGCVQVAVTSTPYFGLRSYGTPPQIWEDGWVGELGQEPTVETFVAHLMEICAEVWRVLRDDGVFFLNIADSYAGSGKGSGGDGVPKGKQATNHGSTYAYGKKIQTKISGIQNKSLCLIPARVAIALQEQGWIIRNDIAWVKVNPMPESTRDRFTRSHEYIWMCTKKPHYFSDMKAVATPVKQVSKDRLKRGISTGNKWKDGAPGQTKQSLSQPRLNVKFGGNRHTTRLHSGNDWNPDEDAPTANRRDTWIFSNPGLPKGDVVYGTYRIASQDCPVHDYQADLSRVLECDAQLSASDSRRNHGNGFHLSQSQEGAVVAIPLDQSASLSDETFAISRNMRMNKTEDELGRDVIFFDISECHTACKELILRSVSTFGHKHANNTEADVSEDAHDTYPLERKTYRIFCIATFTSPPGNCTCHYTGKVEKRQDHYAVFPLTLPEICIKGFSREGDLVLDPFAGSGQTAIAASRLGRNFIGIELKSEYIEISSKRIAKDRKPAAKKKRALGPEWDEAVQIELPFSFSSNGDGEEHEIQLGLPI